MRTISSKHKMEGHVIWIRALRGCLVAVKLTESYIGVSKQRMMLPVKVASMSLTRRGERSFLRIFLALRDFQRVNHPRTPTDHPVQMGQLKTWKSLNCAVMRPKDPLSKNATSSSKNVTSFSAWCESFGN